MRTGVDRDLAVDVLIVGAGLPALHIARALHPLLSVCVVSEPGVRYESYDTAGRFSAGYDGNDVARIQPARRAAGYWRLWAESNGVAHDPAPSIHVLRPDDEVVVTRRWADAGLAFSRLEAGEVPPALAAGSSGHHPIYATPDDVVIDPARAATELRSGLRGPNAGPGLGGRVVAATVQRFRLITSQAVDAVELALPDGTGVPVVPRFVVLAADAANASLLLKLAGGLRDRNRRKAVIEAARTSQAVRRRPTIVVRGDLPPLTAAVDGFTVTALPGDGDADTIWVVQLPIDDGDTVVGPDDLRFAPTFDPKVLAEGVSRLFELCPDVRRAAPKLRWSAFVARRTEHPMVLERGPAGGARPSPACLETMGMDALIAVWPSHLAYAMIAGDVVAERVRAALGGPAPDPGAWPGPFPAPDRDSQQARWHRSDHVWADWPTFARRAGLPI